MSRAPWLVRHGTPADCDLFAEFSVCADDAPVWEQEVQQFVQQLMCDWVFAAPDARLLIVEDLEGRLVGVSAYEELQIRQGSRSTVATHLQVVALGTQFQGKSFADGSRCSDVLMSATMEDISSFVPPRESHVLAVVHRENVRSRALCQRYGFDKELSPPGPNYLRLST